MTRWLAISNRTNSAVTITKQIWGVPKRYVNQISKTQPGDTLLVYVGQQVVDKETTLPPAITGCFEITSTVYEDTKPIFTAPPKLGNEVFPLRIKLKTVQVFDPPVEFKPLIPDLTFITNKTQWSGHIRGEVVRAVVHLALQTRAIFFQIRTHSRLSNTRQIRFYSTF
jgi:predicted RNA-binding protein